MHNLPLHGGDLRWASETFVIPEPDWLDLSTGVSPWAWPVQKWPAKVFHALPPDTATLIRRAARYYGCAEAAVLPMAGSQQAICLIPQLLAPARVAVPFPGYGEHAKAWQAAGHAVAFFHDTAELFDMAQRGSVDHVVVINPNNPTAESLHPARLRELHSILCSDPARDRLLLVDEAFADMLPDNSMAAATLRNLLVLRSFGKFFGMAGVRLGFVIDPGRRWLEAIEQRQGAWPVSHPAVYAGEAALGDQLWIVAQRLRVAASNLALLELLTEFRQQHGLAGCLGNGGLFITMFGDSPPLLSLFEHLGRQAILTRYGQSGCERGWLRFGLAENYERLRGALRTFGSFPTG